MVSDYDHMTSGKKLEAFYFIVLSVMLLASIFCRLMEKKCTRKLEEGKVLSFHRGRSPYSCLILNGVWRTGISAGSLAFSL